MRGEGCRNAWDPPLRYWSLARVLADRGHRRGLVPRRVGSYDEPPFTHPWFRNLSRRHVVIEFDDELEAFVREEVETGHFPSRQALLSHAVQLLRRDRQDAVLGIMTGLEDIAAERIQPVEQAVAEIRHSIAVHAKKGPHDRH